MALTAQYASTPRLAAATLSAAAAGGRTSAIGIAGTLVFTAGTNGSRVDDITIQATVTTTAGAIRLFVCNGVTTCWLYKEVPISANTVSATNGGINITLSNLALLLPNGYTIRATSETTDAINVIVTRAGDF